MSEQQGQQAKEAAMERAGEYVRNPVPRRNEDRAAVIDLDGQLVKKLETLLMSANALMPPGMRHDEQMKWQAEFLLRNAARNRIRMYTTPVYNAGNVWDKCLKISETETVDESIRAFVEDPTGDNSVCMVRDIIQTYEVLPKD